MFAFALPVTSVLIWSMNNIVNKAAAGTIGPMEISLFRWMLAGLVLTPLLLVPCIRNWRHIRPHLLRISVLALLGMVGYQSFAYYAAYTTTAMHMGILAALSPMTVMLLSALFLAHRVTGGAIVGCVISFVGVIIVVTSGRPLDLLHGDVSIGDGLMMLGMTCYAIYMVLLRRWPMPGVTAWQLLYLQVVIAVFWLLPLYLVTPKYGLTVENIGLVAYAGLAASVIAPFTWMLAVARIGPTRTAMFFNLVPLFTAVFAAAVLGEKLEVYHLIGGALTVAGVLLAEIWKAPPPTASVTAR